MELWLFEAAVLVVARFVQGMSGFGAGLVALAFLPYVMDAKAAVVLVTLHGVIFTVVQMIELRRYVTLRPLLLLCAGTFVGTPLGVWLLSALPAGPVNITLGALLIAAALLDWLRANPPVLRSKWWAVAAGVVAGTIGGAGIPGPPVVMYATSQGWEPRQVKANLQGFFMVNQSVALAGFWMSGLLTSQVVEMAVTFAIPSAVGLAIGMAMFGRVDAIKFRRMVYGLIFLSGVGLLLKGG